MLVCQGLQLDASFWIPSRYLTQLAIRFRDLLLREPGTQETAIIFVLRPIRGNLKSSKHFQTIAHGHLFSEPRRIKTWKPVVGIS
jgi:hypothetical protein